MWTFRFSVGQVIAISWELFRAWLATIVRGGGEIEVRVSIVAYDEIPGLFEVVLTGRRCVVGTDCAPRTGGGDGDE